MGCLCSSSSKSSTKKETISMNFKGGKPLHNDSQLKAALMMTMTKSGHMISKKIEYKVPTRADIDKLSEKATDDFKLVFGSELSRFDSLKKYLYLTSIGGVTRENVTKGNITMIINATYEWPIIQTETITSYRVPVDDGEKDDISIYFDEVSDKIYECQKSGGACIVHCLAGASRSTTLVLAYLMKYEKMPLKYAYNSVRKRRNAARPNLNFWIQLIKYEKKVRNKASVEIKTTWEEGFEVKYPDIYLMPDHLEFYKRIVQGQLKVMKARQIDPSMKTNSQKQFNESSLKYE